MIRLRYRGPRRRRPTPLALEPALAAHWAKPDDDAPPPRPEPNEPEEPEEPQEPEEPEEDAPAPEELQAADEPEAPPPAERSPEPAEPPAPEEPSPPPLAMGQPPHQKLMLYASAAIVVLIVIVILALGSRTSRRALGYVPMGASMVQVVDMRRFTQTPVFTIVTAADHPIARNFEVLRREWGIDLKRDVQLIVDAADRDDMTLFLGRFDPERLGEAFRARAKRDELKVNAARAAAAPTTSMAPMPVQPAKPVELKVEERTFDGHPYLMCAHGSRDEAFVTFRSSLIGFGRSLWVERVISTYGGERDSVLKDSHLMAAYSPRLARKGFLRRLEKGGGPVLTHCLKDLLGDQVGVRAAFFVLHSSDVAVTLTARLAADTAEAAKTLEAALGRPEILTALKSRIAPGVGLSLARDGEVVTLEASVDLALFERLIVADAARRKTEPTRSNNLLVFLLED